MNKILQGWSECYYNFLDWWNLLQEPYNHFYTWEFFTYLNPEANEPYFIQLPEESYDALMKLLEQSGDYLTITEKTFI